MSGPTNRDWQRINRGLDLGQRLNFDREQLRQALPARVANVAGLPPTFIGVGALDIFVDENIAYARRLIEAGVPTELLVVPGAFHGFDMIVKNSAAARRLTAAKLDALRRAFVIAKT